MSAEVALAFPIGDPEAPATGVDRPCGRCGMALRLGAQLAAAVDARPVPVLCPVCFVDVTPGGAAALEAWLADRRRSR